MPPILTQPGFRGLRIVIFLQKIVMYLTVPCHLYLTVPRCSLPAPSVLRLINQLSFPVPLQYLRYWQVHVSHSQGTFLRHSLCASDLQQSSSVQVILTMLSDSRMYMSSVYASASKAAPF